MKCQTINAGLEAPDISLGKERSWTSRDFITMTVFNRPRGISATREAHSIPYPISCHGSSQTAGWNFLHPVQQGLFSWSNLWRLWKSYSTPKIIRRHTMTILTG